MYRRWRRGSAGWQHPPGPDLGLSGPNWVWVGRWQAWLSGCGGCASSWWWVAALLPACSSAVARTLLSQYRPGQARVAWFASAAASGRQSASVLEAEASGVNRNACAILRSYEEMEKLFKVCVEEEGEPPVFHDVLCHNIY